MGLGTVWVLARHRLVAQALEAALRRRLDVVRAHVWETNGPGVPVDEELDLVLLVEDMDAPETVAAVLRFVAGTVARTVVMTARPKGHVWGALLAAGSREVVAPPPSIEELAQLLERVGAGEGVIPDRERTELCESWERHVAEERELLGRMATLSSRELTVLRNLASGRRSAEISEALGVAESTVRTHVRSIRRKLDVDSQLRAVLVYHRLESRIPPVRMELPFPRRPQD